MRRTEHHSKFDDITHPQGSTVRMEFWENDRAMRITEVRVIVTCPTRNYVLVKIMTDEPGLYGVGDATLNGRELAVASLLRDHIAPLLLGKLLEFVKYVKPCEAKGLIAKAAEEFAAKAGKFEDRHVVPKYLGPNDVTPGRLDKWLALS